MKLTILTIFLMLLSFSGYTATQEPVIAKNAMVVSEQALATQAGVDVLRAGGNAIDAAVAVGYALAVVNPCCGNIGGGGFMTIHLANGKNTFLNFREMAPGLATANMFLDTAGHLIANKSTEGYLAVGVPGTVLGFDTALKKYGTLSRQKVMSSAIQLAEKGYRLTPGDVTLLTTHTDAFQREANVAAIFLKAGQPLKVGDRLVQTQLANTLKKIAALGPDVFYQGAIAKTIVQSSTAAGGVLRLQDFANYQVTELTPIYCTYRNYQIISAPPPSSGGVTLCEIMNIVENYPLKSSGFHTAKSTHYIVEAMRYAFFDRNQLLGDPRFITNPVASLTSKDYANNIVRRILDVRATPSSELSENAKMHEGVHTTHYSIVDKWGNAVSVTYTLNSYFGAKVIAGNTGFFLNDVMDDFSVKVGDKNQFGLVQGEKNNIQPGKQPLSSMTPTIITRNNHLFMVVGSPGGPRIITATLETILNVIDYKMNIQAAVNAERFHHQWLPDTIDIEPNAFSAETMQALTKMGYAFTPQKPWSAVEAIYIDPVTKWLHGANDKRRPAGRAIGY